MKWFKHDVNARHDLKLRIVVKRFGMAGLGVYWGIIETLAEQSDLSIRLDRTPLDLLADEFKMPVNDLALILKVFAEIGLIDAGYYSRGVVYCSTLCKRVDEYTQRVKTIRKPRIGTTKVSGDYRDNVGLEQNRTEEIRTEQNPLPPEGVGEVESLVRFWNENASGRFCQINAITPERRKRLSDRFKSAYFRENWQQAITRLTNSSFASGSGGNGWRANFDWFIRNDNSIVCVMEGKYDDAKHDKYTKPYGRR